MPGRVLARDVEALGQRGSDACHGLRAPPRPIAAGPATAHREASRRPAPDPPGVRPLLGAVGLDAAARAPQQPLAAALAARDPPALHLGPPRPEVVRALDEGDGPRRAAA